MSGNFIVSVEASLSNTNETNILYVSNPSINTKQLSGIQLIVTSLSNSSNITFRIYVDPVLTTSGTSLIPFSQNFVDGTMSSMNVYSFPISTSKGTKINTFSVATSTSNLLNTSNWYLLHGHSFLITAQTNTSNKGLAINISWSE